MSKKEKISYPPQWCKYCAFFGDYGKYYACYNVSWWRLILEGPKIVAFDATCKKFQYDRKYKSTQKSR